MNAKIKKSLKLVTLLVTALVIGVASAATYSYMFVDGSIIIGAQKLVWIAGADAPAGTLTTGDTATINFNVQSNVEQVFTEALFLKNQDTADHNLTITVTTALLPDDFSIANAVISKNSTGSWVDVGTLTLTTTSDPYSTYTGNTPLIAGGFYRLTFDIKATATSGTKPFDLQVVYE